MQDIIVRYRRIFVVATHLVMWTASLLLAFALRFDFSFPNAYRPLVAQMLALSLVIRTVVHWRLGLFHGLWRYSGTRDLRSLLKAATLSSVIFWYMSNRLPYRCEITSLPRRLIESAKSR